MSVDPKLTFWLGVVITVFLAVGNGSVSLTHIIPDAWIPTVQSWDNLIGFVGTAVLTGLSALSSTKPGPIAKLTGG